MSNIPVELKYTKTHEWVRDEGDGVVSVGITDHAQELLGDLVFVEHPEVGAALTAGSEDGIAVVESVKAASDIYCPINGEVIEINEALADAPETINGDPYESGWIFKLKAVDGEDLEGLMDAEAYAEHCESEDH